jgi:hypothetical protein
MSEQPSRRLTVGAETFIVKFAGPYTEHDGMRWFAITTIARGESDRTICGHFLIGSTEYEVGGLSGTGPTPEDAYRALEQKLVLMKSREPKLS